MSENKEKNDDIIEYGQTDLDKNKEHKKIHLLNIIGEIEGWWRCGVWTCNSRDDCKYE